MTPDSKPEYRRIRNGWGLALAGIWIVYRWNVLDAEKRTALALIRQCDGIIDGVKCFFGKGTVDGNFTGGVFLAVLVSPLAFILTHYYARWQVEQSEAAAKQREEAARAASQAAQQRERDQRMAQVEGDASKARESLNRGEFIHKLGTVGDFLDLLGHETDPARIANIRLGVSQALRDLVAKHPVDQLAEMIAGDTGVRLSLETVLARLAELSLNGSGEAQILIEAQARATAMAARPPLLAAASAMTP